MPRDVGKGNALYLADVAEGVSKEEKRRRFKQGRYPHLHPELAKWALKRRGY